MSTNSLKNERSPNIKPKSRYTQYQLEKKDHATMGVPFTQSPDPHNFLKKCTGRRCYGVQKEQTATVYGLPKAECPKSKALTQKPKAEYLNPTPGGSKSTAEYLNPTPSCSKSRAEYLYQTPSRSKSKAEYLYPTPGCSKSKVEVWKPKAGCSKSKVEILPPKKPNFILDNIKSVSKMKPKQSLPAVVFDRYGTRKPAPQPGNTQNLGRVPSYLKNFMKSDKTNNESSEEDLLGTEKWKTFKDQCKSLPQLDKDSQEAEEKAKADSDLLQLQKLVACLRRSQLK